MVEISTQTANRIKWARYVVASYQIHGTVAAAHLAAAYKDIDGYQDGLIENAMKVMTQRLVGITDEMRELELAVAAEKADDKPVREERDAISGELRDQLYQGRDAIARALGEKAVASYGLAQTPPRQPDALVAYTANVVNLLRANPRSATDAFGNTIDTAVIATTYETSQDALEGALDDMDTELRELHIARAERDKLVNEWDRVYRGTASVLSGLYLQAGREDLADRVRPTVRRSTGKTEPPEDLDDLLEDDEPVVDEDVVDEDVVDEDVVDEDVVDEDVVDEDEPVEA